MTPNSTRFSENTDGLERDRNRSADSFDRPREERRKGGCGRAEGWGKSLRDGTTTTLREGREGEIE